MATILVVDAHNSQSIAGLLSQAGYRTVLATDTAEAMAAFETQQPDLIVMDPALPDNSGLVLLPRLNETPLIMCSADADQVARIAALRLGADDFMSKPLDGDELAARIEAVLRRSAKSAVDLGLKLGDLTIGHGIVRYGDQPIHLTPTEHRLLKYLAERESQMVPYGELLLAVWGTVDMPSTTVSTPINRLRTKLRDGGVENPRINTVWGVGYVLHFRPAEDSATSKGE